MTPRSSVLTRTHGNAQVLGTCTLDVSGTDGRTSASRTVVLPRCLHRGLRRGHFVFLSHYEGLSFHLYWTCQGWCPLRYCRHDTAGFSPIIVDAPSNVLQHRPDLSYMPQLHMVNNMLQASLLSGNTQSVCEILSLACNSISRRKKHFDCFCMRGGLFR